MTDIMKMADLDRGRYLHLSRRYWWKHDIAKYYGLDPRSVNEWDTEDVMEALARIADDLAHQKKK